jgi:hypothetical protein
MIQNVILIDANSEDYDRSRAILLEIIDNFGDPLELIREMLSNGCDAKADLITISIEEYSDGEQHGYIRLTIRDNGSGMRVYTENSKTHDQMKNFFALGQSDKRAKPDTIGMKGFGSKISFTSDRVAVESVYRDESGILKGRLAKIEKPYQALSENRTLEYSIDEITPVEENGTYTSITIDNFSGGQNLEKLLDQRLLKEYIKWYTACGSCQPYWDSSFRPIRVRIEDKTRNEEIEFDGKHEPPIDCNPESLRPSVFSDQDKYSVDGTEVLLRSRHFAERVPFDLDSVTALVDGQSISVQVCAWILGKSKKDEFASEKLAADRDRFGLWLGQKGMLVERHYSWVTSSPLDCNFHVVVNCDQFELNADRTKIKGKSNKIYRKAKEIFDAHFKDKILEIHKKYLALKRAEDEEIQRLLIQKANREKLANIGDREEWPYSTVNLGLTLEPSNELETCMLLAALQAVKGTESLGLRLITTSERGTDAVVGIVNTATGNEESKIFEVEHLLKNFVGHNHPPDMVNGLIVYDIGDENFAQGKKALRMRRLSSEYYVVFSKGEKEIRFLSSKPTAKQLKENQYTVVARKPILVLKEILSQMEEEATSNQ